MKTFGHTIKFYFFHFSCSPRPVHEMISGIGFLPSLHRHTRSNGSTTPPIGDDHQSHDQPESGHGSDGFEGRYISVCRDASLFFWKNNLTLQRTISVQKVNALQMPYFVSLSFSYLSLSLSPLQLESSKLTWVTGIAIMPNVNKLMLSFTDNMLSLYDLSSSHCDRLFQIVSLPYCVLNMDYW